ncbi:MFS transporter [Alicyclobacillus macrosporangiidus]|uniref:MFS transporter n=1 Tax=Alicyclobacillus macrosporangiidus TaxID=392015 RepID=UPI000558CC7E|nr:MFS transporter [Alicyclobacillus macrosporangiidus]MCL6446267.1 MFS transporter [Alicyclobacillus sp.]
MSHEYWKLWWSQLVNQFGNGFYIMAVSWIVYQLKGSSLVLGDLFFIYTIALAVARVLFSPLADKFDRKKLMIWLDLSRSIIISLPAALVYLRCFSVWELYIIFVVVGILGTPYVSSRGALIRELVNSDSMNKANAWMQGATESMYLIGPTVAGIFIARFGGAIALLMDGLTFLFSSILISFICLHRPVSATQPKMRESYWSALITGLNVLMKDRILLNLTIFSTAVIIADTPFMVLVVPYVTHVVHGDAGVVGLLQGALSGGVLVVSIIIGKFGGFRRKVWTWGSVPLFCAATICMAFAPNMFWAILLQIVAGISTGLFDIRSITMFQSLVRNELLGRTLMINNALSSLASALCAMLAGIIAAKIGVALTFLVFGLIGGSISAVVLVKFHRIAGSAQMKERLSADD